MISSNIGFNPYTQREYNSTNGDESPIDPKSPLTFEKLKRLQGVVYDVVLANAYLDWQLMLQNPHASSHQIKRGRRELNVIRRLLRKMSYDIK